MKNKDNFTPEFHLMFLDVTKIFDYLELELDENYKYPVIDFDKDGVPLITNQYGDLITLFPEELQYTILIENEELPSELEIEIEKSYSDFYKQEKGGNKVLGNDDRLSKVNAIEAFNGILQAEEIIKRNVKNVRQNIIDRLLDEGNFEELESFLKNNFF